MSDKNKIRKLIILCIKRIKKLLANKNDLNIEFLQTK